MLPRQKNEDAIFTTNIFWLHNALLAAGAAFIIIQSATVSSNNPSTGICSFLLCSESRKARVARAIVSGKQHVENLSMSNKY